MQCHDEDVPVFWIQCGVCCSWYNVARSCVGFGEEQAESIKWICPGCPDDVSDTIALGQEPTSLMMNSFLPASPSFGSSCCSPERALEQVQPSDSPSFLQDRTDSQEQVQPTDAQALIELHIDSRHNDSTREELPADKEAENDAKPAVVFNVGDRVNVKQHSWAYLNHPVSNHLSLVQHF
jgi:hypothetical protein